MSPIPLGIVASSAPSFIPFIATGGTIIDEPSIGVRRHIFNSSGTFTVTQGSIPPEDYVISYRHGGNSGNFAQPGYAYYYYISGLAGLGGASGFDEYVKVTESGTPTVPTELKSGVSLTMAVGGSNTNSWVHTISSHSIYNAGYATGNPGTNGGNIRVAYNEGVVILSSPNTLTYSSQLITGTGINIPYSGYSAGGSGANGGYSLRENYGGYQYQFNPPAPGNPGGGYGGQAGIGYANNGGNGAANTGGGGGGGAISIYATSNSSPPVYAGSGGNGGSGIIVVTYPLSYAGL